MTKRYVDDGAGLIESSPEDFTLWIEKVNENLEPYGLHVDESSICPLNSFIPFLDIQFCFDDNGDLQTDLFVKPTDSRAYLNFGSAHPKHTFSGIVYSGCFRLRRIINNQERLETRLQELKACFKNAGYPDSLIDDSIRKALGSERSLNRKVKAPEDLCATPSIRVVSTFGSDSDIVNSVRKFESSLTRTRSFSESDISNTLPSFYPRSSTPTQNNLSVTNRSTRVLDHSAPAFPCLEFQPLVHKETAPHNLLVTNRPHLGSSNSWRKLVPRLRVGLWMWRTSLLEIGLVVQNHVNQGTVNAVNWFQKRSPTISTTTPSNPLEDLVNPTTLSICLYANIVINITWVDPLEH